MSTGEPGCQLGARSSHPTVSGSVLAKPVFPEGPPVTLYSGSTVPGHPVPADHVHCGYLSCEGGPCIHSATRGQRCQQLLVLVACELEAACILSQHPLLQQRAVLPPPWGQGSKEDPLPLGNS